MAAPTPAAAATSGVFKDLEDDFQLQAERATSEAALLRRSVADDADDEARAVNRVEVVGRLKSAVAAMRSAVSSMEFEVNELPSADRAGGKERLASYRKVVAQKEKEAAGLEAEQRTADRRDLLSGTKKLPVTGAGGLPEDSEPPMSAQSQRVAPRQADIELDLVLDDEGEDLDIEEEQNRAAAAAAQEAKAREQADAVAQAQADRQKRLALEKPSNIDVDHVLDDMAADLGDEAADFDDFDQMDLEIDLDNEEFAA